MKNLNLLPILFFLSLILVFPSCGGDEEEPFTTVKNELVLNGKTINLSKGFITDLGPSGGVSNFLVYLTSSGVSVSNNDLTGTGDGIELDFYTSSADGLVAGSYNFTSSEEAGTLFECNVDTGRNYGTGAGGETFSATGGKVDIAIDGNQTTFTINLTINNGSTVSGTYKGALTKY